MQQQQQPVQQQQGHTRPPTGAQAPPDKDSPRAQQGGRGVITAAKAVRALAQHLTNNLPASGAQTLQCALGAILADPAGVLLMQPFDCLSVGDARAGLRSLSPDPLCLQLCVGRAS
jgi:hypothetical protein